MGGPTFRQSAAAGKAAGFEGWAILHDGQWIYLPASVAEEAFEIVNAAGLADGGRDHLPHRDPVPHQAQARIDGDAFRRHWNWALYHEQSQAWQGLPFRAAQAVDELLRDRCEVTPTRTGKKFRAQVRTVEEAA